MNCEINIGPLNWWKPFRNCSIESQSETFKKPEIKNNMKIAKQEKVNNRIQRVIFYCSMIVIGFGGLVSVFLLTNGLDIEYLDMYSFLLIVMFYFVYVSIYIQYYRISLPVIFADIILLKGWKVRSRLKKL